MKKFVSYIRVSTKGQEASGLGLEAQQAMIRRHMEGADGILLAEYREAESGKTADRPELQRALERCREEGATLLIAKLDRLARNVHFISGLMQAGVPFIPCDMPDVGPFMLHVQAAFAEEEARRISSRTREALAARRARGLPMGGQNQIGRRTSRLDAAWEISRQKGTVTLMEQAESFARTLQPRVGQLRQEGKSLGEIARVLEAEGFRTSGGRVNWSRTQVKRILNHLNIETSDNPKGEREEEGRKERLEAVAGLLPALEKQDMPQGRIADYLNSEGLPSFTGHAWNRDSVREALRRLGQSGPRGFVIEAAEMERIQAKAEELSGRKA